MNLVRNPSTPPLRLCAGVTDPARTSAIMCQNGRCKIYHKQSSVPFRKRLTRQSRDTEASLERLILRCCLAWSKPCTLILEVVSRLAIKYTTLTSRYVSASQKFRQVPYVFVLPRSTSQTSLKEAEEETGQFGRLHLCLRFWCYGLTGNVN